MDQPILSVQHLVKSYGGLYAVDDISFSVPKGKVIGFLGPNGAGKSTTIQMLLGITLPSRGNITYFGRNFARNREYALQRINYVSAFNELLGRISVYENLVVYGYLYGLQSPKRKIDELLHYFEIAFLAHHRYNDLSTGQKTRVNITKALLNDPSLILMDEPTASLDPDIADKTLSLIEDMRKKKNLSILFTSHDMEEVTRICDHVIFLQKGKIVAEDTPLGLTKRIPNAQLRLTFQDGKQIISTYLDAVHRQYSFIHDHLIEINSEETLIPKIVFGLSKLGIWITDIEVRKPTLEDVFLHIARGGRS